MVLSYALKYFLAYHQKLGLANLMMKLRSCLFMKEIEGNCCRSPRYASQED